MNKAYLNNISGQVCESGLTKNNILFGFYSTGIYPVNSAANSTSWNGTICYIVPAATKTKSSSS